MEIQTPHQWTPYAASKQALNKKVNGSINLNNKTTVNLAPTNSNSNDMITTGTRHISTVAQHHQQQTVQQEYQCHPFTQWDFWRQMCSQEEGLWKGWTRTTTAACTCCHIVSAWFPLYCWLTSSTVDRVDQKEHKGQWAYPWHRSSTVKEANKQVHWYYACFLRHLRNLVSITLAKHSFVDHCNCTSFCVPQKILFTASVNGKGISRCTTCGTRYYLLKCKGVHRQKSKVLKNKDTN